ncbi:hypothetical protein [Parapedobacter sp. 10938]|uniref:hypothetical protein n=1 Tax=Parapedobacter flavus TaxID=3110225 RepID=UPI002DBCC348|nr:hypothetical protein [Parapedobacter sp. 10938]MEC3881972.1 hypothetical protein [Parapedobacter sp. 10938]
MTRNIRLLLLIALGTYACDKPVPRQGTAYADTVFMQDYSVKYSFSEDGVQLQRVEADRDGKVQMLASDGLKHLRDGRFLHPGSVVADNTYRFMSAKAIVDMVLCQGEFVYLDKRVVFSNAWSGRLFVEHQLDEPTVFAANDVQEFLVTDGRAVHFIEGGAVTWKGLVSGTGVVEIVAHPKDRSQFFLLADDGVYWFSTPTRSLEKIYDGANLTALDVDDRHNELVVGTADGYFRYDLERGEVAGDIQQKLPWTDITAVKMIDGNPWFGTSKGAFVVREGGDIAYYASKRWLPSDHVLDIAPGPDTSVLLLTDGGLGVIHFKEMTLHEKAMYYEQQVRKRHIRNGFNATLVGMQEGDLSTGYLGDSDNDGLWTSLYLAAEAFRYATTGEQEALDYCMESLDAMGRLYDINPVPGFPARSFERRGTADTRDILSDPERWQLAEHPEWYWKATTSSDEAIGHIFAFGVIAELVDHEETREKAIRLIDTLMGHIVKHDLYLVDYDGQPTTWGRWNPEYVNAFPTNVGDRKLNSSNIIGMLQTAYHFTGKSIYRETAFDLMDNHGYLENLLRPMEEIGKAPEGSDDWSQMLSGAWNHSDDEMYFAGYWGLYRYAFNDTLQSKYGAAIRDHWQAERPEKEGAWNIFTAITGADSIDLEEAVWYLKEYPLDLIQWTVTNSHRKDIDHLAPNFRGQTTAEVLPPDELKISRHNANRFTLDGGSGGRGENSAGDIWLFPYWMGRYLGVIEGPAKE